MKRRCTLLGAIGGTALVLGTFAALPTPVRGAEATKGPEAQRKGPLAGLPSKPGPHLAKIEALGDNSWLELGKPGPDPKFGLAPGRSYCNKMAYARGLGGAFLHGEGVHGGTDMRGGRLYYNDDVFFYDARAHAWICVHPGSDVKNLQCTLDKNGFELNQDGEPVPVTPQVHGYECNEYIPDIGKFMTLDIGSSFWHKALDERRQTWLKGKKPNPGRSLSKHPYLYDVRTGKWERPVVAGGPAAGVCTSLIHLPKARKVALYSRKSDLWLYDYARNEWSHVTGKGASPATADYEGVSCYDSKRQRICAFNRNRKAPGRFGIYDVQTNTWLAPKSPPDAAAKFSYDSCHCFAHYDSAGDRILLFFSRSGPVFAYDPEKDKWTPEPISKMPETPRPLVITNAFYDTDLNAHFFFRASPTETRTVTVYRYKKP